MIRLSDQAVRRSSSKVLKVLLGLGLLAAIAPGRVEASPIRSRSPHSGGSRSTAFWDDYFTRALEKHSTHVVVPRWLKHLPTTDGLLTRTPFVQYLEWRRSLNPARFDRYHPQYGPILAGDQPPGSTPQTIAPQRVQPSQIERPPLLVPHRIVSPRLETVPEPGMATIGLALLGSVTLARRLRRRLSPALLE